MSDQVWWYVARAGGLVAWALLALSMFWGLALSSRLLGKFPKPNWMLDLHRFIGGLSVVFIAVHIGALVADSYVTITVVNVLVPFTGTYRVVPLAWGIVATYLLVAVEITSLLRRRLPRRLWRAVHMLSFPMFVLATVHLLLVGTDRTTLPLRIGVLATVTVLSSVTLFRIATVSGQQRTSSRS
ncbi:MAG TPA: ferric reductase-like transmembrane domain-containing protein [Ilumatobacteraceae bacterium]|nr:ferric reductase-like transmembrane domain-containing protein [Ilumatobacteraceae bacterium]HRB02746.1 ferric reductase-like transmembrane domain-containing protein [Ilumatobacteraceae bacterium]